MYLNSRTLEILNWIKTNLERPGMPEPKSHSRQFYLSVSRLSSGEFGKVDLKLVLNGRGRARKLSALLIHRQGMKSTIPGLRFAR